MVCISQPFKASFFPPQIFRITINFRFLNLLTTIAAVENPGIAQAQPTETREIGPIGRNAMLAGHYSSGAIFCISC
jgi:hypothetical protein